MKDSVRDWIGDVFIGFYYTQNLFFTLSAPALAQDF